MQAMHVAASVYSVYSKYTCMLTKIANYAEVRCIKSHTLVFIEYMQAVSNVIMSMHTCHAYMYVPNAAADKVYII